MVYIKKAKKRFIIGIILIAFITAGFYSFTKDVYKNQKSYKEHLIRFHVIANSDSKEDQALKLKVRDRIIKEMNPKFENSKSLDQTRMIIEANLSNIEKIAKEEIKKNNSNYSVKAMLGNFNFPTKNYGAITLPAGNYEALRVVIGEGEGANWWCVLFPPLCFIDINNGLTDERTKQEMMNVLTEEEFKMIQTARSSNEMPIKLKFKVVEILEYAKSKFDKVVGMK
ncbi:stage II sporulation protein R [Crassaminicella thermophila]|uniref:Stage II sporulation protein R n=2 Tax=Crassaminicella thermophila TaxID=2599308 RepID=A0A5C0SGJ1_CRATE|nr:stage II sporulation protein R [Crassaminicella thermophila]